MGGSGLIENNVRVGCGEVAWYPFRVLSACLEGADSCEVTYPAKSARAAVFSCNAFRHATSKQERRSARRPCVRGFGQGCGGVGGQAGCASGVLCVAQTLRG